MLRSREPFQLGLPVIDGRDAHRHEPGQRGARKRHENAAPNAGGEIGRERNGEGATERNAGDEAADVRRQVDPFGDDSVHEVRHHEVAAALRQHHHRVGRNRRAANQQEAEQTAVQPEDGAGSAGRGGQWVPEQTREAAGKTRSQIQHDEADVAEEAFGDHPDAPQHEHVHQQMNDADMNEHGREQAPPLAVRGERTIVGAPSNQHLGRGADPGRAARHHGDKYGHVHRDEHGGDEHARRRRRHRLRELQLAQRVGIDGHGTWHPARAPPRAATAAVPWGSNV